MSFELIMFGMFMLSFLVPVLTNVVLKATARWEEKVNKGR